MLVKNQFNKSEVLSMICKIRVKINSKRIKSYQITVWILFFLGCLSNIQKQLIEKRNKRGIETHLSPKEKSIYTIFQNKPNIKSRDFFVKLGKSLPTVKRIVC